MERDGKVVGAWTSKVDAKSMNATRCDGVHVVLGLTWRVERKRSRVYFVMR